MNFITNTLKENLMLIFCLQTGKVSLVYEIETDDVYEDFYKNKDLFDLSGFDPVNKKVADKMKEELKGKITSEFVGLKSKIYSLIDVDDLFNKKMMRHNIERIQSKLHRMGTYNFFKKFLCLALIKKDTY